MSNQLRASARVAIRTLTPKSYEAVAVALGPMAYWPLDKTNAGMASDYISGANGVCGAAVVLGWPGATANTGTSAGFNGWNANMQAIYDLSLDVGTGDFTVAAWIYPEA
jgi:hypothetical protein